MDNLSPWEKERLRDKLNGRSQQEPITVRFYPGCPD